MTTARDLALVALGLPADRRVEQGDLSLTLAGAEAVDLLAVGALTLKGDLIVPNSGTATGDRLLDRAVTSLVRREPYETVGEWLWRRGDGLAADYAEDLARAGLVPPRRTRGFRLRSPRPVAADSPERRRAEERQAAGEPVLATLAAFLKAGDTPARTDESPVGDAVTTVLAAVGDAVTELEAVRLRRGVEEDAFENLWRG
ncbi:GPP34 family phosphoprotein [Streptomyces sp. NPDC056796]|uniref:GPP34 family phosphoprotein n=1 Tax=Streptomyces sp. NPDC056796 TaxID=3345947 RepID=UPI0036C9724F